MEPHDNITQIDLGEVYQWLEGQDFFNIFTSGNFTMKNLLHVFNLSLSYGEIELSHPQVKDLINGDEEFDLVMTEYYATVGAAFAYRFNCPLIGFVSMDAIGAVHNIMGNPTHPLMYPPLELGFYGELNFKERWQHDFAKKYFGKDLPPMYDLTKNVSILLINSSPAFHTVRPLHRNTVNIGGGMHIEEPKSLPMPIQEFLDQSKEGVIYFSLGTCIRSSQLANKTKSVIIETFSHLPYKILWKYEADDPDPPNFPKNIHKLNWVPQQDVLRHPNVKLFITQGGLLSLEEALYINVPVLVLPFFSDQFVNAKRVVQHGFGLSLDHKTLEVAEFTAAIQQILASNKYKEAALKLATQLLDRPWTGIQTATWWIEYILRHGNMDIFKHPNLEISFYQYYFLDVIFVVLCGCVVVFCCLKLFYRGVGFIIFSIFRKARKVKED